MNKSLKHLIAGTLVCAAVLTGCTTGNTTTTAAQTEANTTTAQTETGSKGAAMDVAGWFEANEGVWRTVENGKWSNDPKDAPNREDLEKILATATKSQSAIGWNPYFFVAVEDPAEQKAIIGDAWEGATSEGTVTILILADQIADPETS